MEMSAELQTDEELLLEIEAATPSFEIESLFCQETLNNIKSEFEVDEENEKEFRTLLSLVSEYNHNNIFFIGAFGIFYSHTLDKPEIQDSVCSDGRQSESRITALISTSISSEEKPPVLILSSTKSHQSFQNVGNIFVKFCQESRSWLTVSNLKEHLGLLDKQFEKQDRKVLFLADKSIPRHLNIDLNLKSITLAFIPHSTQSPFQSGIINKIKTLYRAKILNYEDTELGMNESVTKLIEIWKDIPVDLIKNCCLKTKLFGDSDDSMLTEKEGETLDMDTMPDGFEEFVNCDNFLFTHDPVCVEMENNPNTEMEFKQEFLPIKININRKHHAASEFVSVSETKKIKIENEDENSVDIVVEISDNESDVDLSDERLSILEMVALICIQQNKILRGGYIDDQATIEQIIKEASSFLKIYWPSPFRFRKWFKSFIEKHDVVFDAKPEVNTTWINLIMDQVTIKHDIENIFFVGEFAFYINLHPSKNSEILKKQLSVLMGVNYRGNKKLPLFVIGSEESPVISFEPTQYIHSPDGMIKKIMFKKYLDSLNMSATKNGKKLLVFCDHFLFHLIPTNLHKNITLRLLPPTITSPIEHLTLYLKYNYRQMFIKNEHHTQDIRLADTLKYITEAWQSLKVSFINAIGKKSGWKSDENGDITNEDMGIIYDPAVEFNFQLIHDKYDSFMKFVEKDDYVLFFKMESIADICKAIESETKSLQSKTKAAQNLKCRLQSQLFLLKNQQQPAPQSTLRMRPVVRPAIRYAVKTQPKKVSSYSEVSASIISKMVHQDQEPPPLAPISSSSGGKNIFKINMNNIKESPHPFHDIGVIKWIEFAKNNNIEITNIKLRFKAQKIAERLSIKGFNASKKWLKRFKLRHAIDDDFLLQKPALLFKDIDSSTADNAFSFCIFPLFYKSTPQQCNVKVQQFLGSGSCSTDEFADERFIIMFCANKSGNEKLPLIVVGQRKIQDISFLKHQHLLKYYIHPKSILTKTLFENQMIAFDRKFQYEKRKVQFFIKLSQHYCTPVLQSKLRNIKLKLVAEVVKLPYEDAFVEKFKTAYRSAVLARESLALDNNYESESINTFEAITMLHDVHQKIGKAEKNMKNNEKEVQIFNRLNVNQMFEDIDDFIRFDAATSSHSRNKTNE